MAYRWQCLKKELDLVCTFFCDDSNKEKLVAELSILHLFYLSTVGSVIPSIDLSTTQGMLLKTVCQLFQFLLILPTMNTTSERSFNALHCIRLYLRTTMSKARINYLMILHHQDMCDRQDMKSSANEYMQKIETRTGTFAIFLL